LMPVKYVMPHPGRLGRLPLAHFVMHDSQAACLLRVHRGLRELRCPYRQNERLPPCSDLDNCGHDVPYETPWRCPAPRLAPVPIHTDRPSLFRRPPRSADCPRPYHGRRCIAAALWSNMHVAQRCMVSVQRCILALGPSVTVTGLCVAAWYWRD
jgi:hypothetical protein